MKIIDNYDEYKTKSDIIQSMPGRGRSQIRTVMYMGMMSGIRLNPIFKGFYQKLLAQGKAKKNSNNSLYNKDDCDPKFYC